MAAGIEVAGHITFTVSKQRKEFLCSAFSLLLILAITQCESFPSTNITQKILHRRAQGFVSKAILDPGRLTPNGKQPFSPALPLECRYCIDLSRTRPRLFSLLRCTSYLSRTSTWGHYLTYLGLRKKRGVGWMVSWSCVHLLPLPILLTARSQSEPVCFQLEVCLLTSASLAFKRPDAENSGSEAQTAFQIHSLVASSSDYSLQNHAFP